MSFKRLFAAISAFAFLALMNFSARADDHPYGEGPVVSVAFIRTVDGKFEDYMKWVATTWKAAQEAAKSAGYIASYEVLTTDPRTPDDPDVLLVIRYKNWAGLDGWIAKGDEIVTKVEGSVAAGIKGEVERASIRRVLGSKNYQELTLK